MRRGTDPRPRGWTCVPTCVGTWRWVGTSVSLVPSSSALPPRSISLLRLRFVVGLRPRTIRGVFFLLVDARAPVVPWCLSHLLPREKKLSSPLLSIGSERGKVDRFVRVRTRFPSGFVVGSNPNDGPIEPGWWWRKTPSDHHRSGNTNTRHVRHHVRETSVDVDRNVRNQG